MALDFPASPNINDTYTFGGVTWTYDGTTWKVLGRFQFTSSETDPVFTASPASNIIQQNITNWNLAYGWGDHSTSGYATTTQLNSAVANSANWDLAYGWGDHSTFGYLTSLGSISGHTDVTIATLQDGQLLKYSVTNSRWENWNPNYLTSYTETDPVFTASPAGGISGANITNWNTAYSWGNHANAGYLTSYNETLQTITGRGATSSNSITLSSTLYLNSELHIGNSGFRIIPNSPSAGTHTIGGVSGVGGIVFRCGQSSSISFTNENGTNTFASISAANGLTAGGLTYPKTNGTAGQVLSSDGAGNVVWGVGGAGGANVTISDTAPGSAVAGDLWWESDKGRLKIYYNDTDSSQWVDASPPLSNPLSPVAVGYINMNGTSPTWSGTTGYSISGAQPGGAGTDYVYTLTFPSAYAARTDYIVQATYDGTNYIETNSCELAVARGTTSVVFTPRRLDGQPLNQGEIMVTITNL